MKISVIGTGYVGLVQAAGMAAIYSHDVMCMDINSKRIENLRKGIMPIHEPGLEAWVSNAYFDGQEHTKASDLEREISTNVDNTKGKLYFTDALGQAVAWGEVIFICVGTPPREDGSVDISALKQLREDLWRLKLDDKILIIKSTVPPGTTQELFHEFPKGKNICSYAMNPEFLREGYACHDFQHPDRIIIGYEYIGKGQDYFNKIYPGQKIETCHTAEAELVKYASNAFLAMKISYAHEIQGIAAKVKANPMTILDLVGKDTRIGSKFLHPGIGYGGSCFPKDTLGLKSIAEKAGIPCSLTNATIQVNNEQMWRCIIELRKFLKKHDFKRVTFLGTAFKEDTDDIRESVAVQIIKTTVEYFSFGPDIKDITFKAHDPQAITNTLKVLGTLPIQLHSNISNVMDADLMVVLTPWEEYYDALKDVQATVIDFRNMVGLAMHHQLSSIRKYYTLDMLMGNI